jgi:acetate kinase
VSTPILVLNCGSSSVKYQVIDVDSETVLATGLVEKIGLPDSVIAHKTGDDKHVIEEALPDHTAALALITKVFETWGPPLDSVVAVGHRAVHGGELFREPVLISEAVTQGMTDLAGLAPLHNPPGVAGIKAAQKILPNVPHVAVFDTAFFSTLPAEAYTYAINTEVARKYGIRKYGFHGTSHSYVSKTAAAFAGRELADTNQIICHLGNGASISAIKGGIAVDTSMGLTPLQGLVMGTRSGDVDPGVFAYLARVAGMDSQAVDDLLNKQSGMSGLNEGASDFRDILAKTEAGDEDSKLAIDIYLHRLVAYIGSYMALLGRTDQLIFTAGVGENAEWIRTGIVERLAGFGLRLDESINRVRSGDPRVISTADSTVSVLVVPTNEELAMARETYKVIRP